MGMIRHSVDIDCDTLVLVESSSEKNRSVVAIETQ